MSEELIEKVTEQYQYEPEDNNEKLITDKPSEPLKVIATETTTKVEIVKENVKNNDVQKQISKKETKVTTKNIEVVDNNIKVVDNTIKIETPIIKIENKPKKIIKSNKELYESYIKELKNFSLIINGEIIYDSRLNKFNEIPISFENDYFVLYSRKYSYNGLKIQKINK